ncbi:DUF4157 domain-containing protein [Streptomyces sp. NPDC002688]|uniref:eCIS core domain-containing protein n=1 Tax=Streptomyces sp. NPDC002688 TaxID=3154423 RepID=UPI003317CAB8
MRLERARDLRTDRVNRSVRRSKPHTHVARLLSGQGGARLEPDVRAVMEASLGADFSSVRVHTGQTAQESAQLLHATAYTVGRDVAFARGTFAPRSAAGQELLAHELAHVVQNGAGTGPVGRSVGSLSVSEPTDATEREAREAARAVASGRTFRVTRSAAAQEVARCGGTTHPGCPCAEDESPLFVQRQVMAPPRPPVMAPPRPAVPEYEDLYTDVPVPEPGKDIVPRTGERYAHHDPALGELLDMLEAEGKREAAVAGAEVPQATLERGGRPPDFITVAGRGAIATESGTVRHVIYLFHILDAIEYDVAQATTEEELEAIAGTYFPTMRQRIGKAPRPIQQKKGRLDIRRIHIAPDLDPGGEKRSKGFHDAVKKKGVRAPKRVRAAEYERNGCIFRAMSGAWGRDPVATFYCQEVTHTENEVRVMSPEYPEGVVFDALVGDTAYECKCGYTSYVRNFGSKAWWAEWGRDKMDEQMMRHQRVTQQCGLQYRYMVSNKELASLLRDRWGFGVTVLHMPSDLCD